MPHAYILAMSDGSYYVGSTDNLESRLSNHRQGKVKTTKSRLPFILVFAEPFSSRGEAQKREYQIKHWKSKRLIQSLLLKSIHAITAPSSNG